MLQYLPKVRLITYVVFLRAWNLKVLGQKMHYLMDCTENVELAHVNLLGALLISFSKCQLMFCLFYLECSVCVHPKHLEAHLPGRSSLVKLELRKVKLVSCTCCHNST